MTTSVTILNHGPDSVSVAPINDAGETVESERQTVQPNGISRQITVYDNRHVHVAESKPLTQPKP
jgi:hypothetical protein